MARAGYTNAPCEGCGEVGEYYGGGREKGKVCPECQRLIALGREIDAARAANPETQLYSMPWAAHAMPYLPHLKWEGSSQPADDQKSLIQQSFYRLLQLVGVVDNKAFSSVAPAAITGSELAYREDYIWLKPEIHELLSTIYTTFRDGLENAYREGKKDAKSVVVGLVNGNYSIDEFTKISTKQEDE